MVVSDFIALGRPLWAADSSYCMKATKATVETATFSMQQLQPLQMICNVTRSLFDDHI